MCARGNVCVLVHVCINLLYFYEGKNGKYSQRSKLCELIRSDLRKQTLAFSYTHLSEQTGINALTQWYVCKQTHTSQYN